MSDPTTIQEPPIVDADEVMRLYEDEQAGDIFDQIFNPDDMIFDKERDGARYEDCVTKIAALGYSREAAQAFMDENLADCPDEDGDEDDDVPAWEDDPE